ncbi:MAG: succinate dehydrogenase assembly factor 2 [Gammaproteobacteria bacterium]|nr:succinate dehydrogenase assembly factor 2 [Gammaproteobacteria bacterium]
MFEENTQYNLNIDKELARLKWQCRRGMLELDAMLQSYLDKRYSNADKKEKAAFEVLLNYPDQDLLEMLMERNLPTDKDITHVITQIREAAGP